MVVACLWVFSPGDSTGHPWGWQIWISVLVSATVICHEWAYFWMSWAGPQTQLWLQSPAGESYCDPWATEPQTLDSPLLHVSLLEQPGCISYKWHVLANNRSEPQLYAVFAQAMPPGILMLALQTPPTSRHSPLWATLPVPPTLWPPLPQEGALLGSGYALTLRALRTKAPRLGFLHKPLVPRGQVWPLRQGWYFVPLAGGQTALSLGTRFAVSTRVWRHM